VTNMKEGPEAMPIRRLDPAVGIRWDDVLFVVLAATLLGRPCWPSPCATSSIAVWP